MRADLFFSLAPDNQDGKKHRLSVALSQFKILLKLNSPMKWHALESLLEQTVRIQARNCRAHLSHRKRHMFEVFKDHQDFVCRLNFLQCVSTDFKGFLEGFHRPVIERISPADHFG